MTEARRLAILGAIVEDYVRTQDPVGSKALGDRHNLGVSSATIRNDMAQLEEDGLITQPHTSAGRIPTDAGYRLFVDRIAAMKRLTGAERRAIERLIAEPVDLDHVLEQTVRALAQLTHQVAVITYPSVSRETVRHIDLIALTERRVLAIVITDSGRVEQRPLTLPGPVSADDLAHLRDGVLCAAAGHNLDEVPQALHTYRDSLAPDDAAHLGPIIEVITDALGGAREERIIMAGTPHLTRSAHDLQALGGILEILEEQVVLLRLMSDMPTDPSTGVAVRIGRENPHQSLATTSVVASGYQAGEATARLAVLGPTRMDYPTTMAAVQAVARYVSRLMGPHA